MKIWSILACVLALTLCIGSVSAKGNKGPKAQTISGDITKIDGTNITISPKAKKGATDKPADVIVATTDSTTVTVNGEKKALTDLVVGEKVKVTLDTDGKTATAFTIGKKKDPAPAAPAAPTPPAVTPAPAPTPDPAK